MKKILGITDPREKPIRMEGFLTHFRSDLDEIYSMELIGEHGEEFFPGARQALEDLNIRFWGGGLKPPRGVSEKDWILERGFIPLGVGQWLFNEHPGMNQKLVPGKCTAEKVANFLGVAENPEVKQLLRYVMINDTRGSTGVSSWGLAGLLKSYYEVKRSAKDHKDIIDAILYPFRVKSYLIKKGMSAPKKKACSQEERLVFLKKREKMLLQISTLADGLKKKKYKVKRFILKKDSFNPVSELAGIYFLRRLGGKFFRGIEEAEIVVLENDVTTSSHEALEKGDLHIGCGDGIFSFCPGSAIAHVLGINDQLEFMKVLKYVRKKEDPIITDHPFEFQQLLFDAFCRVRNNPNQVIEWGLEIILLRHMRQKQFCQALSELDEKLKNGGAKKRKVGEKTIITVYSDHGDMAKASRFGNHQAFAVVVKNSRGNCIVQSKNREINKRITANVRYRELKVMGSFQGKGDVHFKNLFDPGTLKEVPNWHFHEETYSLMNGGKKHPHVEPTKLNLGQLFGCIERAILYVPRKK